MVAAYPKAVVGDLDRTAGFERRLLAALIVDAMDGGDGIDLATERVGVGDFSRTAHRTLFGAILDMHAERVPFTLDALYTRLRADPGFADLGPEPDVWLADLTALEATGANVGYYSSEVLEASSRRTFSHTAAEIMSIAATPSQSTADAVAEAESLLFQLRDSRKASEAVGAEELVREGLAAVDDAACRDDANLLTTGFSDLDSLLGGFEPGNLVIVGARPSCGKTALAAGIASNAIGRGQGVYFASLEMQRKELMLRLFAMRSGVSLSLIQKGKLTPEQAEAVTAAGDRLRREPLLIDDADNITAARLASACRRAVRRRGVRMLVVDYLGLVRPEHPKDPRHLQVGTLARRFKELARSCNLPVILLAQLNREVTARGDGRPRLSDLRDSGEVEAHADVVLLLHPHDDAPADAVVRPVDVIVAKNRNGPTGQATLAYRPIVTRFENQRK